MSQGTLEVLLVGAKGLENTDFLSKFHLDYSLFSHSHAQSRSVWIEPILRYCLVGLRSGLLSSVAMKSEDIKEKALLKMTIV